MINLCDLLDWLVPSGGSWIHGSMGASRGRKWHIVRVRALVPNTMCFPTLLRLVRSRRRNHIVTMNNFVHPN